jgi:glycine betaine/proline transport system substrate-binding protein
VVSWRIRRRFIHSFCDLIDPVDHNITSFILGWYIPRYVLTDVPGALFGDFADPDVAAYFNNTVYVGDQDWLSIQYEIIAQNNFSLNVVELPGEDELMDLLYTHYAQKQPLLFYFWSPHLLPAHIQLIRVQLPNDSKKFLK